MYENGFYFKIIGRIHSYWIRHNWPCDDFIGVFLSAGVWGYNEKAFMICLLPCIMGFLFWAIAAVAFMKIF